MATVAADLSGSEAGGSEAGDAGPASPGIGSFAVYATEAIELNSGALITGCNVGVEGTAGPFLAGNAAVDLNSGAQVQASQTLYASSVYLNSGASIGAVDTESLTGSSGAKHGTVSAFPTMPAAPALPAAKAGTTAVTVNSGASTTLAGGNYGDVTVSSGATLSLPGGAYVFSGLTLKSGATLSVSAATTISVTGSASFSSGSFVGPASGSGLTAKALAMYFDTSSAIALASGAQVQALVVATNARVTVSTSKFTGALAAAQVVLSSGATITCQDGFGELPCMPCATGVCGPGSMQCDPNSNGVDTCATGQWGAAAACVNQACVSGACTGVCAPGETRCDPNSNGVDTCSAVGQWSAPIACNNTACVSGAPGAPDPGACTGGTQLLPGHAPTGIGNLPAVSALPPTTQLTLGIALPLLNESALKNFISALSDPNSGQFHQYLTPAQFADAYGASPSDYSTLVAFVQSSGLTVTRSYTGRNMLEVTGTVAAIESTFNVQLNVYQRADGTFFFAPAFDPSVNLDVPIRFITGLDSFAVPVPANSGGGTLPSTCTPSMAPAYGGTDMRNIYLPCATSAMDGTGQTIGLVELGSYYPNDISDYTTFFGMPAANLTNVPVPRDASLPPLPALTESCTAANGFGGKPGAGCLGTSLPFPPAAGAPLSAYTNATYAGEVALDIEMAHAMAPGANIRVYEQDSQFWYNLDLVLSEMAEDDIAQQISSSWSWTSAVPDLYLPYVFYQFAAQGQSVFWAAGDFGAYVAGNPQPYVPDPIIDSPYMTVVGGTSLSTSGTDATTTYASETTWNNAVADQCFFDGAANTACKSVGGGGFCTGYPVSYPSWSRAVPTLPMPAYQNGVNPSNAEVASNPQQARMIPDVSMVADNFFVSRDFVGRPTSSVSVFDPVQSCGAGTSAAAPLWAGIAALVNQQSVLGPLGFANPQLYALAASPDSYASNFHDVADNSNDSYPSAAGAAAYWCSTMRSQATTSRRVSARRSAQRSRRSPPRACRGRRDARAIPSRRRARQAASGARRRRARPRAWARPARRACQASCSVSPMALRASTAGTRATAWRTCDSGGNWGAAATCEFQQYPSGCITEGSAGSTTHSNGTGQTFTDCSPADNYTQNAAIEACAALDGQGGNNNSAVASARIAPGAIPSARGLMLSSYTILRSTNGYTRVLARGSSRLAPTSSPPEEAGATIRVRARSTLARGIDLKSALLRAGLQVRRPDLWLEEGDRREHGRSPRRRGSSDPSTPALRTEWTTLGSGLPNATLPGRTDDRSVAGHGAGARRDAAAAGRPGHEFRQAGQDGLPHPAVRLLLFLSGVRRRLWLADRESRRRISPNATARRTWTIAGGCGGICRRPRQRGFKGRAGRAADRPSDFPCRRSCPRGTRAASARSAIFRSSISKTSIPAGAPGLPL